MRIKTAFRVFGVKIEIFYDIFTEIFKWFSMIFKILINKTRNRSVQKAVLYELESANGILFLMANCISVVSCVLLHFVFFVMQIIVKAFQRCSRSMRRFCIFAFIPTWPILSNNTKTRSLAENILMSSSTVIIV